MRKTKSIRFSNASVDCMNASINGFLASPGSVGIKVISLSCFSYEGRANAILVYKEPKKK